MSLLIPIVVAGIVLAVNIPRLTEEAERTDGVIEFAPQVGDFVGSDEPLFLLHGGVSDFKSVVRIPRIMALKVDCKGTSMNFPGRLSLFDTNPASSCNDTVAY